MYCVQFLSLRNLQNTLCDLARVRIRVRVRFRSEICKLRRLTNRTQHMHQHNGGRLPMFYGGMDAIGLCIAYLQYIATAVLTHLQL